MPDNVETLKKALRDRYRVELELGAGRMAVSRQLTAISHQPTAIAQLRLAGGVR